jgi:Uma2 family endonuclease
MKTQVIVPVEEYLSTVYRPDCDYVDGVVEERNVGENDHAYWQREILFYLCRFEREMGIYVIQEQRVQVGPTRFRVPDIAVMLGGRPTEPIFTTPPLICIEVLSPEDRFSRLQQRIDDYLRFGVRQVWVVDPKTKRAWIHDSLGNREIRDGVLRFEGAADVPQIVLPLRELFD